MLFNQDHSYLSRIISNAQKSLEKAPAGILKKSVSHGRVQYYQVIDNVKHYIPMANTTLIRALAQKEYDQKMLDKANQLLSKLNKFRNSYDLETLEKLADSDLITPLVITTEEFVKRWTSKQYKKQIDQDGTFITEKGEHVRSKSEVIIADRLFHSGIPYRYEQELQIGNAIYYPDFTILNKRTKKEYLLEHFGMMNNPAYATKAIEKINRYASCGYIIGDNLLCTFETSDCPLDTKIINRLITLFLT